MDKQKELARLERHAQQFKARDYLPQMARMYKVIRCRIALLELTADDLWELNADAPETPVGG